MNEALRTENLYHTYSPRTPFEKRALVDVNFHANQGEFVAIIGHTGSGKSTLIQHFNGLMKPTSGKVFVNGQDIWQNPANIRDVRFTVGMVFQYPEHQLFAETVMEDISFGPRNMGLPEEEIFTRARMAAEITGILPKTLCKSPFELSGGQKRRVAIAGVLAMQPEIIILDEPAAGLDPEGARDILDKINDYKKATNSTVVLVTHSMEDAARVANRIVVMNHSQIAMSGSRQEIFSKADQLFQMGLSVPQITDVCMRLKFKGVPVKNDIYTVSAAKSDILRLYNEKKQET